jgi:hypothetical protein
MKINTIKYKMKILNLFKIKKMYTNIILFNIIKLKIIIKSKFKIINKNILRIKTLKKIIKVQIYKINFKIVKL